MSDEEKNAIEITKRFTKEMITRHYLSDSMIDIRNSIETTLNLIEKQQKEIEKLQYKIEKNYNHLEEMYIPKQKIKDKIEEIKNKKDNLVCYETKTKMINKIGAIQLLQELLEE